MTVQASPRSETIDARVDALRQQIRLRAIAEQGAIHAASWKGMQDERRSALNLAKRFEELATSMLDEAVADRPGNALGRNAWNCFQSLQIDLLESLLSRRSKLEMVLAQLQGASISFATQRERLMAISPMAPAVASEKLEEFERQTLAVGLFLRDLATAPMHYFGLAKEFLTGKVAGNVPSVIAFHSPSVQVGNQLVNFLTKRGERWRSFLGQRSFLVSAIKYFGAPQIGLITAAYVFEVLASTGEWGQRFAKLFATAEPGTRLEAALTGRSMKTAISETLVQVGIASELPPPAGAVIASGIAIAAPSPLSSLFEHSIVSLFAPSKLPRGARLSMTLQTYTDMTVEIPVRRATPFVSLPR